MHKKTDRPGEMGWQEELLADCPCGFLRCTYEKYPRVLSANPWMFRFWGTDEESEDWKGLLSQNVFFMLPVEERELFRGYLEAAGAGGEPLSLEHRVVNCQGGTTPLLGWLRVVEKEAGAREYQFLYMQMPDTRIPPQKKREQAYQEILKQNYDMIFELDHRENTMACVYKRDHLHLWFISAARFVISDMVKRSFLNSVHQEDREKVASCIEQVTGPDRDTAIGEGICLGFRTCHGPHIWQNQVMVVGLDDRTTLICGRDVTEGHALRKAEEIEWLRAMEVCAEGMKRGHVPKGMIFRVKEDLVYPLSDKNNICRFCDISEEELFRAREIGIPMEQFLRLSHVSRGECWLALRSGETTLEEAWDDTILDRRLYISKQGSLPGRPEEYTMLFLYLLSDEPFIPQKEKPRVRIQTFGHFDVFVDDQPVVFRYEKSKEMLAVLVDRGGGFVANPYVISCLWENEPYNQRVQGRCRQTAHRMMETLKQYGIEDIVEKVDGRRRIIPEKVSCDLFHHKMGVKTPGQVFNGTYMMDYSWGEVTLSGLLKEQEGM